LILKSYHCKAALSAFPNAKKPRKKAKKKGLLPVHVTHLGVDSVLALFGQARSPWETALPKT